MLKKTPVKQQPGFCCDMKEFDQEMELKIESEEVELEENEREPALKKTRKNTRGEKRKRVSNVYSNS